ncbi:MAG: hypothetical protein A2233_00890 [Candidatus Kerfeldbacteria bacterium RIFOXYA2_FULL_38_24]|uniref:Uncharacterized protein n=1 Tax=Candidatus Kerfeldbacteria bacterium RIFOXYB2_FULL_38_14 TaxID=1798547 RepID=A0A1G2BII5_9BACT|nr:MAG: hypothetical protein A2233_00890 [Candidatus Kerfeldbacteria bacterium RIFOXYA2_FULL_38_24]OGY88110.1 MAG: hypothetical protein A2319_01620 [Candidatus Kerfeldbacteria bacterium RIFOXYB2_FULL_38_14]
MAEDRFSQRKRIVPVRAREIKGEARPGRVFEEGSPEATVLQECDKLLQENIFVDRHASKAVEQRVTDYLKFMSSAEAGPKIQDCEKVDVLKKYDINYTANNHPSEQWLIVQSKNEGKTWYSLRYSMTR